MTRCLKHEGWNCRLPAGHTEPCHDPTQEDDFTHYFNATQRLGTQVTALLAQVDDLQASVERNRTWLQQKSNEKVQAIKERDEALIAIGVLQTMLQPPGSPPPGNMVTLVHWIVASVQHRFREREEVGYKEGIARALRELAYSIPASELNVTPQFRAGLECALRVLRSLESSP